MNLQDIRPFEGLGDLKFDTLRPVVRQLLGAPSKTFRKSPLAPDVVDDFQDLGLHLFYDEYELLDFIEAFPEADPAFDGIRFFQGDLDHVLRQLAERGHTASYDDEAYDFTDLGFLLYVPYDEISNVSIYRHGYYDNL